MKSQHGYKHNCRPLTRHYIDTFHILTLPATGPISPSNITEMDDAAIKTEYILWLNYATTIHQDKPVFLVSGYY